MGSKSGIAWHRVGVSASLAVLVCMIVEYFLNLRQPGFDATDHWLSEYVLSPSPTAVWIMRICFIALGTVGWAVGKRCREWHVRALFQVGAVCLAAMVFFDTDPNDGRSCALRFPLTHGNVHLLLLSVSMSAILLAITLRVFLYDTQKGWRGKYEAAMLGAALSATFVQAVLAAAAQANHVMTRFGGITERLIVVTTLAWVLSFCGRD